MLSWNGWGSFLFNNSASGWEAGLQRDGLLYSYDLGCCLVMSGAVFYLTTRPGIGRLDFRGVVCCIAMVVYAVL